MVKIHDCAATVKVRKLYVLMISRAGVVEHVILLGNPKRDFFMGKLTNKIVLSVIGLVVVGLLVFSVVNSTQDQQKNDTAPTTQNTGEHVEQQDSTSFAYNGEEGKDALTLLNEKTTVEQNQSGLVVSINNRKADETKREFWALYINGEMAQVGPSEYITKDTDKIEWKIDQY